MYIATSPTHPDPVRAHTPWTTHCRTHHHEISSCFSQSVILGPSAPHDTTKRARPLSLSLEYRPSDPKVQGQGFKDPATGRQPSTAAQAPTLTQPRAPSRRTSTPGARTHIQDRASCSHSETNTTALDRQARLTGLGSCESPTADAPQTMPTVLQYPLLALFAQLFVGCAGAVAPLPPPPPPSPPGVGCSGEQIYYNGTSTVSKNYTTTVFDASVKGR